MASRTGHIEFHAPAGLLDRALAFALRAHPGLLDDTVAVAVAANILPRDVQTHDAAANRRPEGNIDLVFEVAPGFRAFLRYSAAASTTEHTGEDVAKSAASA